MPPLSTCCWCGRGLRNAAVFLVGALSGCVAVNQTAEPGQGPCVTRAAPAAERRAPAATSPVVQASQWRALFDGRTLNGWKVLDQGAFVDHAEVRVADGTIVLGRGQLQTGIGWQGDLPRDNYEVALEAMRTDGHDFFCGLTFPVGEEPCTLIIGGWGGTVVGLSNVDGSAAVENETTTGMSFEDRRWYRIRLRVTAGQIEAWIDDKPMISLPRAGHHFSVWWEQEPVRPLGVATWDTGAALRHIKLRQLSGRAMPPPATSAH